MVNDDTINNDEDHSVLTNDQLNQWETNLCPLCSLVKENTKHVIQCTHVDAKDYRQKQFLLCTTWLTTQRSDPFFRDCVSIVLKSEQPITFCTAMRQVISSKLHIEAAKEQGAIGLINFLFGRLSKNGVKYNGSISLITPRKRIFRLMHGFDD